MFPNFLKFEKKTKIGVNHQLFLCLCFSHTKHYIKMEALNTSGKLVTFNALMCNHISETTDTTFTLRNFRHDSELLVYQVDGNKIRTKSSSE